MTDDIVVTQEMIEAGTKALDELPFSSGPEDDKYQLSVIYRAMHAARPGAFTEEMRKHSEDSTRAFMAYVYGPPPAKD